MFAAIGLTNGHTHPTNPAITITTPSTCIPLKIAEEKGSPANTEAGRLMPKPGSKTPAVADPPTKA
mgnify:CR=1 FL=1